MPSLSLPDGRRLGYETYGDPDGTPVLFFHGTPGSRLGGRLFEDRASDLGVRLVAPDRPGMGLSTFQSGRRFLDWPADVEVLADHLDFEQFGVVGLSGGGPSAAACGHAIPDRLTRLALVSAVPPPSFSASRRVADRIRGVPGLVRLPMTATSWASREHPETVRRLLKRTMADADAPFLDGEVGNVLAAEVVEAFRSGTRGPALDSALLARPWGFGPATVSARVHLWHGAADRNVPVEGAHRFAAALPDCEAEFVGGEGHLSTAVERADAILRAVMP